VGALAALPLVAACNTSPGAAAVVGSERISTSSLESQVNESLASGQVQKQQGFNRAAFTRELLAHMISVDLINAVAAQHNVTVDRQDITAQTDAFIQQTGSLTALKQQAAAGGVTAGQLPGFIRYAALQQKLSKDLVGGLTATPAELAAEYKKDIDQFDQLDIAQIAVKNQALAQTILRKVRKNPASFAALAQRYSLDTSTKANGGHVGFVGRTAVQKALGGATAVVTPGTFAVAHASGNYDVIHIISRRTQPEPAVTAQLKTSLFSGQAQTLLEKALSAEATKLGVHVSPRYGRWDSSTDTVVVVPDPVSSSG
jgi:parvulin-like peptidyl-prolyl isomerase